MDKTLGSLLEDPRIAEIAPDAISKWDLSKEEFYHWTLREIDERNGWHSLEPGFAKLFEAADTGQYYFKLYSEEERENAPERANANFVYFRSDDAAADRRPFVLLVPGGGFVNVWNLTEGWPVARLFNELGYHVFILTYQVETEGSAVKAMGDIARAMEIISARKEEFHVNPDNYITCGFSAGGYIVCLWNTGKGYSAFGMPKPKACFPIYPLTSFRMLNEEEWEAEEEKDKTARAALGITMEEACGGCFEIPEHVGGFPPTAVFVMDGDELVDPMHSKALAKALEDAGIPCRLEVGPGGRHGFAEGTGTCMAGWPERAIRWYEQVENNAEG